MIDAFARAAFRGNGAWFLGSGVSIPSGLPDWPTLLKPFANPLNIKVRDFDEDLPAIAQYIINYHSGNRGPLIRTILDGLRHVIEPSAYHRAVARSSIGTIWTTNYDLLIESSLSGIPHVVRSREEEMTSWSDPKIEVEVIKAHGSVNTSGPRQITISTEDFEDYAQKRPATLQRLRSDLLSKSFLFVGYGYRDPNIQTALIEARRLSGGATLPHYMLQTKIDDPERNRRQDLWHTDLRRIGVDCVVTPNHEATQRIVEMIALRSRGPTIYITGSHTANDPRATEIGELLAVEGDIRPILLDGQSTGTSRTLLSAFQTACVVAKCELRDHIRFYANPYASNPAFSNDPNLMPMLKRWRAPLLRQAHTVLVFDGGMGTMAEVDIARDLGCQIVPIPQKEGAIAELLNDVSITEHLEACLPGYVHKAKSFQLTPSDVVSCTLAGLPQWL